MSTHQQETYKMASFQNKDLEDEDPEFSGRETVFSQNVLGNASEPNSRHQERTPFNRVDRPGVAQTLNQPAGTSNHTSGSIKGLPRWQIWGIILLGVILIGTVAFIAFHQMRGSSERAKPNSGLSKSFKGNVGSPDAKIASEASKKAQTAQNKPWHPTQASLKRLMTEVVRKENKKILNRLGALKKEVTQLKAALNNFSTSSSSTDQQILQKLEHLSQKVENNGEAVKNKIDTSESKILGSLAENDAKCCDALLSQAQTTDSRVGRLLWLNTNIKVSI